MFLYNDTIKDIMNIILGSSEAEKLSNKYIVLELDTISTNGNPPIEAYCVVNDLAPEKLAEAIEYKEIHNELINSYRNQHWNKCQELIKKLQGFWGEDVDTFYQHLLDRVDSYAKNAPDSNWSYVLNK